MHKTVLTGITTTGTPHLGNYVGAIRPAIEASVAGDASYYFFLADFHALIKCNDPKTINISSMEVATTWLAMGLDPDLVYFYRQSDIPEITELTWLLTCVTAKGLMNRAHAYKAAVDENVELKAKDPDKGVTMGLFSYPVLMAADILLFNSTHVPVGKDQIQHIEMARDIAARFNHIFGDTFSLPEAVVDENTAVLKGLDGRKMSKSYGNTIPLFAPEKNLRKAIMKIKTNSLEPGEPKDYNDCTLFEIYSAFATKVEIEAMKEKYRAGISWGEAKQMLFEHLDNVLKSPREEYNRLMNDPGYVEEVLKKGAEKTREKCIPFMDSIRSKTGYCKLGTYR